jgi:alpha-galactosidase
MFLHLDYFVTESSGHNSEYNAWFRKRPDLIEKYCTHGTGWNPGEYAYILKEYQQAERTWKDEARKWFAEDTPIDLKRGEEYAAHIINALMGGEPFHFNGNVSNTNLITNLPQNACVEVPVWVSRKGFEPVHVGNIPPQCAALTNLTAQIEEMAVEAALTGDARLVFHAIMNDPLTSAVLSLAEIEQMVSQMFEQNKAYLPNFKS